MWVRDLTGLHLNLKTESQFKPTQANRIHSFFSSQDLRARRYLNISSLILRDNGDLVRGGLGHLFGYS